MCPASTYLPAVVDFPPLAADCLDVILLIL